MVYHRLPNQFMAMYGGHITHHSFFVSPFWVCDFRSQQKWNDWSKHVHVLVGLVRMMPGINDNNSTISRSTTSKIIVVGMREHPHNYDSSSLWQTTWVRYFELPKEIHPSHAHLGISWNGGTPKSSILVGFSLINHPFGGTPIDGNLHISFPHWSSAPRRPGPLPGQVVRARRGFAARLHHHRAPWRSHRATRGPYDVRQGQVFVEKTHVFFTYTYVYVYIYRYIIHTYIYTSIYTYIYIWLIDCTYASHMSVHIYLS